MAYFYPSHWTNASNFTSIMQYANYATGDALGSLMCFGVFIITFIALKNYRTSKALAAASFITSIISMFMFMMSMITYYIVALFIFLTVVSSIFTLLTGESSSGG